MATNILNPYGNRYLYTEVQELLANIGPGHMSITAYDTAWIARLREIDQEFARKALHWLRNHQLADGSWGSVQPVYHHDRVISTLIAIIALSEWDLPEDKQRIQEGISAFYTHLALLSHDLAGETIAFEMLLPALMTEASTKGLIRNSNTDLLNTLTQIRNTKLAKAPGGMINRYVTMAFSAETAGPDGLHILDIDNLQEPNGSVAYSPSATAYFVLNIANQNERALHYLHSAMAHGGMPDVAPFDVFEQAWVLWNLKLSGILDESLQIQCMPYVDFLEESWDLAQGIGFAAGYLVKDSDSTAITCTVLAQFDRLVDLDAFKQFERSEYFLCLALEANPSISANIHILTALQSAGMDADYPAIVKIRNFLTAQQKPEGFWIDKWHTSPYYTTAHAIIAYINYDRIVLQKGFDWLINTQKQDGSWGYYLSTAEETAYCLQALVICHKGGLSVPADVLIQGLNWLIQHKDPPYPPLWIGKSLYTPVFVVQSTILSAQIMVEQVLQEI